MEQSPERHLPEGEREPDYRFTLANERTFLAWVRTALALLAGAVALVHVVPESEVSTGERWLAVGVAVLGMSAMVLGLRRWRIVQARMRRGADLPDGRDPLYLGLAVLILGAAVIAFMVVPGGRG